MKTDIFSLILFFFCSFLFFESVVFAEIHPNNKVCSGESCFPSTLTLPGAKSQQSPLPLRGIDTFRFFGFKLYTIGVYAPSDVTYHTLLEAENPRAVIIQYHRAISKDDLIESSENYINKNPNNDKSAFESTLKTFYSKMQDVQAGDNYSVSYTPQSGVVLERNGKLWSTYAGAEFAKAYMGIWLSSYAVDSDAIYEMFDG